MCDTLCALPPASATRTTLFAKNSDRPGGEPQRLEWHPARSEGQTTTTYLSIPGAAGETVPFLGSRPDWMWGVEHGVNAAGVAIGNEAVWTNLDPREAPDALTGMDLVRLGLERAESAAGAVEVMTNLLEEHGQGGACHPGGQDPYWSSFLVADAQQAFVLETSGREWAVEAPVATRAISNRLTIPAFDATHHLDSGGVIEARVDPRLEASSRTLADVPVTVDAVRDHLRSHVGLVAEGFTICMHVGEAEVTNASVIALLGGDGRSWWLAGHPCRSLYVPLWVGRPLGEPPAWERFAALTDDHAPAMRALEAELDADSADDDGWANEAWHRVDVALRDLGL